MAEMVLEETTTTSKMTTPPKPTTTMASKTTKRANAPCLYFRLVVIDSKGLNGPNLENERLNSGDEIENEMGTEYDRYFDPNKQKQKQTTELFGIHDRKQKTKLFGPNKQKQETARVRELRRRCQRAWSKRWIELYVLCFFASIFSISVRGQGFDTLETDQGTMDVICTEFFFKKGNRTRVKSGRG